MKSRSRSSPPVLASVAGYKGTMAAVIFACSVACSLGVAVSGSSGTWSTAALGQVRCSLAATSLPNAGVAIFAGGSRRAFCDVWFEVLQDGCGCERDA
jgi:hypothetical protein